MVSPECQDFLTPLAKGLRLSPTLEINEWVRERRKSGKRVVHLGFGEAVFPLQENVLQAHQEASRDTSYLPVAGLPKLRESIARFQTRRLGYSVKAEQVVVAPGSKPLLFALFDVLKGDVLLPRPSWVSYEPQVLHGKKRVFWVETDAHDRHTISGSISLVPITGWTKSLIIFPIAASLLQTYENALSSGGNPRMLLINSPSNPTGQVFSKATVDTITSFCYERGITLISDEIYADIVFSTHSAPSPAENGNLNKNQVILTGGLSKVDIRDQLLYKAHKHQTYSAGGWRVGFAIFPDTDFGSTIQEAVLAYASECWSAASAPAQVAAAIAFDTTPEMDLYRQKVASTHKMCTTRLYYALKNCGLDVPQPKGAFYLYPSFEPYAKSLDGLGIKTSVQLSRWLIEEFGVAALPGSAFGEDDRGLKGGRYRLRMATSYLYFEDQEDKYNRGYDLLTRCLSTPEELHLGLLNTAIEAIQKATAKLRAQ